MLCQEINNRKPRWWQKPQHSRSKCFAYYCMPCYFAFRSSSHPVEGYIGVPLFFYSWFEVTVAGQTTTSDPKFQKRTKGDWGYKVISMILSIAWPAWWCRKYFKGVLVTCQTGGLLLIPPNYAKRQTTSMFRMKHLFPGVFGSTQYPLKSSINILSQRRLQTWEWNWMVDEVLLDAVPR